MIRIGITGHQSLPRAAEQHLHRALEKLVPSPDVELWGVGSLAVGADQIFARYVLGVGGRLLAVIPAIDYAETFSAGADRTEYERLRKQASRIIQLPFPESTDEAFLAAGKRVVDESDWLVAAWDGEPARGLGGTADIVDYAIKSQKRVELVWPEGVSR